MVDETDTAEDATGCCRVQNLQSAHQNTAIATNVVT